MTQGSVTDSGEPRGAGPTREGATGTGIDGIVAGGAILLSLYGALVILADLFLGEGLVPGNGLFVAGIILGCLLVGGVAGAIGSSVSDR